MTCGSLTRAAEVLYFSTRGGKALKHAAGTGNPLIISQNVTMCE